MSVGQSFALEQALLRPLPAEGFEVGLTVTPRVDRYSRITVRQCHYSVPARLIGHRVRAVLRASELLVFDGKTGPAHLVARHERATERGSASLTLDHYLEVLVRKPGALPGATALVQARASGAFTATHEAFWAAARKAHGDSGGTRALVEVLLLHRHHHAEQVLAGIQAALRLGTTSPDVVAVEARKHGQHADHSSSGSAAPDSDVVVSLASRRDLPADSRPLPTVDAYDELLTGTDAE